MLEAKTLDLLDSDSVFGKNSVDREMRRRLIRDHHGASLMEFVSRSYILNSNTIHYLLGRTWSGHHALSRWDAVLLTLIEVRDSYSKR